MICFLPRDIRQVVRSYNRLNIVKLHFSWQQMLQVEMRSIVQTGKVSSRKLLTMPPQLDSGVPDHCLQHAQCADPAALDRDSAQLWAGGCDGGKAFIAQGTVAYPQGLQLSHASNLWCQNLIINIQ